MDRSNGAKCLRARRGSASSKDEPKAQKYLLAPRDKGKGKIAWTKCLLSDFMYLAHTFPPTKIGRIC